MSKNHYQSRRRFIKILASASCFALGNSIAPSSLIGGVRTDEKIKCRSWSGILLGTEGHIQMHCPNDKKFDAITQKCLTEIQRLESYFSLYDSHSLLSLWNKNGFIKNPPKDWFDLLTVAEKVWKATQGHFDITVHPIVEYFRNHTDDSLIPKEINKLHKLVGFDKIAIEKNQIRFTEKGMQATLNAIAQGFITDRVAEILQQEGFDNVLIELGETRALGMHPEKRPWNIGIKHPEQEGELIGMIPLQSMALATSSPLGSQWNRQDVHHLVNPKTATCQNNYKSISIESPSATLADALSTGLYFIPENEANNLAQTFPHTKLHLYA